MTERGPSPLSQAMASGSPFRKAAQKAVLRARMTRWWFGFCFPPYARKRTLYEGSVLGVLQRQLMLAARRQSGIDGEAGVDIRSAQGHRTDAHHVLRAGLEQPGVFTAPKECPDMPARVRSSLPRRAWHSSVFQRVSWSSTTGMSVTRNKKFGRFAVCFIASGACAGGCPRHTV